MQMQVNLLPKQYRPKPPVRLWTVIVTLILMLNLIAISSYWLTLHLQLTNTRSDLASLQSEVNSLQRQVSDAQWRADLENSVATKSEYVRTKTDQSILWHPALDAIERAVVPGVLVSSLSTSDNGNIVITGYTEAVKSVALFLCSLQAETGLTDVRFQAAEPEGVWHITLTGWRGRELAAGDIPGEEDSESADEDVGTDSDADDEADEADTEADEDEEIGEEQDE